MPHLYVFIGLDIIKALSHKRKGSISGISLHSYLWENTFVVFVVSML